MPRGTLRHRTCTCDHKERTLGATIGAISGAYPTWLSPGDNSWQMTAATLVGLMSVPGLVVFYGGVMQKRWSINSMMLAFGAFAIVLLVRVLWGLKMSFGH